MAAKSKPGFWHAFWLSIGLTILLVLAICLIAILFDDVRYGLKHIKFQLLGLLLLLAPAGTLSFAHSYRERAATVGLFLGPVALALVFVGLAALYVAVNPPIPYFIG